MSLLDDLKDARVGMEASPRNEVSVSISRAAAERVWATLNEAHGLIANIHALMDGREWNSDTTSAIAEALTLAGLDLRDSNEAEVS